MKLTVSFSVKVGTLFSLVCLMILLSLPSLAVSAKDITKECVFDGSFDALKITDGSLITHSRCETGFLSVNAEEPIGGIYIKYNDIPKCGVTGDGTVFAENGFLHEYIYLNGEKNQVLNFEYADICDISVFSEGTPPKDVQIWENGGDDTDLLLCATHSDDDQLFFAGLLPYYSSYKKLGVQVVYFINHFDTYNRTHELLDGLWHCGVTRYPEISPFPDGYSESSDGAMNYLNSKGFSYDDVLSFQRYVLNKYKPLVAVLHDFNGEYGHGAHMLNTESFVKVCDEKNSETHIPEKIYVHLYDKNQIHLNFDEPLDIFGGKSAFNISQEAFMYHLSQHWTWFYGWIYGKNNNITDSRQIRLYNPCEYGLYFSSVGSDIDKNELFEHVTNYSERKRIALTRELKNNANIFAERKAFTKPHITNEVSSNKSQKEESSFEVTAKKVFYPALGIFLLLVVYAVLRFIITRKRKQ